MLYLRSVFVVSCLVLLPPALASAQPAPDELGPYAVGRQTFTFVDEARGGRSLAVDVWYPVAPEDAQGPVSLYDLLIVSLASEVAIADAPVIDRGLFPLVVFSHGNGGVRFQSIFLAETLASHGFVVAAPDHTGNTLLDFLASSPTQEDILQSAFDRPRDVSFVISTLLARNFDPDDPFFLAIHPFKIGVTGHSFGGFTTLAMAAGFSGEVADVLGVPIPDDFEVFPPDPRVRAVAPIAPASGALGDGELAGIRVPTLLVGGTADTTTPIDPETFRPYDLIESRPLYRADVLDAGHFSFTSVCELIQVLLDSGLPFDLVANLISGAFDEGCAPELIPFAEAHRLTNLFVVSFFKRHIAGDARYDRFLRPAYAAREEPDALLLKKRRALPPWLLLWLQWLGLA